MDYFKFEKHPQIGRNKAVLKGHTRIVILAWTAGEYVEVGHLILRDQEVEQFEHDLGMGQYTFEDMREKDES